MRDWTFEYHRTFNGAGAVGEKHVFGSEARLAGKGCQTLAFVRRDICFFSFQSGSKLSLCGFFRLVANVLALGAVADFGAQNCQYTTKVDAR